MQGVLKVVEESSFLQGLYEALGSVRFLEAFEQSAWFFLMSSGLSLSHILLPSADTANSL